MLRPGALTGSPARRSIVYWTLSAGLVASLAPLLAGPGRLVALVENDRGLPFALAALLAALAIGAGGLQLEEIPVARGLRLLWRRAEEHPVASPGVGVAAAATLLAFGALRRHDALRSSAFDLGIFDQVVWEVSHGHGLHSSLKGGSILGDHFEPVLWFLGPLARLSAGPSPLLWLQAAALASAAVPLHLLAHRRFGAGPLPWVLSLALLLYLPLRSMALLDFHPEALAVPALLWACFALDAGVPWLFWAGLVLAALCKESGFLGAFGVGAAAFFSGHRRQGALAMGLSGAGFLLVVGWVIPHFRGGANAYVGERYGYLSGGSLAGLVAAPFVHPWLCLRGLVWPPRKLEYLARLFGPLALAPLFRPRWILAMAPLLAMNLLADYPLSQSIHTQYNAELIALIFAASIDGLAWGLPRLRLSPERASLGLLCLSLALYGSGEPFEQIGTPISQRAIRIVRSLESIPADAAVAAQLDLLPHVAHRDQLTLLPALGSAEYAAFDLAQPLPRWNGTAEENQALLARLLASGWKRIDGGAGDGYLLLRRPPAPP